MADPEAQRQQTLCGYRIVDTAPEAAYDDLVALAARIFDAPIALVTLADHGRLWFKARWGLDLEQTPRDNTFCDLVVRTAAPVVVEDAGADPRFAASPLVSGAIGVRFYAGVPLVSDDGQVLGTLCIMDRRPRALDNDARATLQVLVRQVAAQFELRKRNASLAEATGALGAERRRLQQARRRVEAGEERLGLVLRGANDGWWDWDLVGGAWYYSPRGWEVLGYADQELAHHDDWWERVVHPDDRQLLVETIREAIDGGLEHFHVNMRLLHKHGRVVPILCRGFISRDAQGRAVRVSGTDTDLTERRHAEEALRAEQVLHEQIIRLSPVGIVIYDREGNCVAANEAIARQIGATVEQVRAQNFHRIQSWRETGIYELALQTLRTGEPTSTVVFIQTSFGRRLWQRLNFRLLDADGEPRLMQMADDITDIKRVEQESLENQESYRNLVATTVDGVLRTGADGSPVAANPAACAILGISEEEICQRHGGQLIDETDPRVARLLEQRALAGRASGEITMIRANGQRFEAEISTSVYRDRNGGQAASAIFRDISERREMGRRLEESLNLLNRLAQRVPGVLYQFRVFPDGRSCFPFASNGMWSIYEVTPEQVREDATAVYGRIHPDDYDAVVASIKVSADTLQPWGAEYRVVLPQQGVRWRQGNAQPERLADGSVQWHGYISDATERKRTEQDTHRLAYFDALTGLPNRRLLIRRIEQSIAAARRSGQLGALLFVDLDNFKRINDARGHSVGDALLAQVARRLVQLLRGADMVARLGGDEFVLLVNDLGRDPEAAARAANAVADRVRETLESPYMIDGFLYNGMGSIGLTLLPKEGDSVDDLLREADTAMYRAKAAGRNRVAFFEPAMQQEVEDRLALEQDLKEAIESGQIQVHVQPQVDPQGVETGGELLLRWTHPQRGAVPPDRFIPVAEESGLILRLGELVVRRACEALAQMHAAGLALSLSVNISPSQFRHEHFAASMSALLEQTGAPARKLTLEVTEGLLIDNWQDIAKRMARMADLGVRFSIDDFGTGYSSLAYLKRLPLHELKIDKSFVGDIPGDPNGRAIVQSILAVARHLKLRVVAEGVETRDQADFLVAGQCDGLQGFLFARPMPLQTWLAERLPRAVIR